MSAYSQNLLHLSRLVIFGYIFWEHIIWTICVHTLLTSAYKNHMMIWRSSYYHMILISISWCFWPWHTNSLKHIIWGIVAHHPDDDHHDNVMMIISLDLPHLHLWHFLLWLPLLTVRGWHWTAFVFFQHRNTKSEATYWHVFFCSQILFLPSIKLRTEARYKGKRSGAIKSYFPKDLRI